MSVAQEQQTYEEFYEEWYPRALAMASQIVLRDPESAAQEVLLVFFTSDYRQRWYDGNPDGPTPGRRSFETYIKHMMRNRLISVRRRQSRRAAGEVLVDTIPEFPVQDEQMAVTDFKIAVMEVSRILRRRYGVGYGDLLRELVWLVVMRGERGYHYRLAEQLDVRPEEVSTSMRELRSIIAKDSEIQEVLGVSAARARAAAEAAR